MKQMLKIDALGRDVSSNMFERISKTQKLKYLISVAADLHSLVNRRFKTGSGMGGWRWQVNIWFREVNIEKGYMKQ